MKKIEIDWSSIITNAVSGLVGAVFLAAAIFLWKNTEENKNRINSNFDASVSNLNTVKIELSKRIAELETQVKYQNEIIDAFLKMEKQNNNAKVTEIPDFSEIIDNNTILNIRNDYQLNKNREIDFNKNKILNTIDQQQQPINTSTLKQPK